MRGKRTQLSFAETQAIGRLTYRQAQDTFHIGYSRWKELKEGRRFLPFKDNANGSEQDHLEARLLASVKELPHL